MKERRASDVDHLKASLRQCSCHGALTSELFLTGGNAVQEGFFGEGWWVRPSPSKV